MSIERSPSLKTAETQSQKSRNSSDTRATDGAPGGFAAVMQAQEARGAQDLPPSEPKPKPAEASRPPEKAASPKPRDKADKADETNETNETDNAEKADGADQATQKAEATEGRDEASSSVPEEAVKLALPDAASALALVAAYLQGADAAKSAPPTGSPAPTTVAAADAEVLTGVAGTGDAQPGADALLADGTRAARTQPAADARAGASSLANYATVLEQLQSRLGKGEGKAGLLVPAQGLSVAVPDTGAAVASSATGLAQQNARMERFVNALQAGGGQASADDAAKLPGLAGLALEGGAKAMDRFRGESPRGGGGGSGSDGAFGQHGFTPTVQFDGTATSATVAGQASGDAVADQVSYWVAQGVQNASLTLDGLNAERVEVKISMSGGEAHVEFRSDQAATREMLASTAAHLKDLLSSQGVVLSGVTVGHSGGGFNQGGTDSRQGQPREGQAGPRGGAGGDARAVAAVAPAPAKAGLGTLDLFV